MQFYIFSLYVLNMIYSCDGKAAFPAAITGVFSITLMNKVVLLNIFVETVIHVVVILK